MKSFIVPMVVPMVAALVAVALAIASLVTRSHHAPRCTAAISATDPVTIINGNQLVHGFGKPHVVVLPKGCVMGRPR